VPSYLLTPVPEEIEYIWPWDNLPESFFLMWEDHFQYLDPCHDGLPVEIQYYFTPAVPGKTDGPWEGCYPAEPAEIEVLSLCARVPYSSDGAKCNHLDAYPSSGEDALTCRGQQEFCNALLGAWEAWYCEHEKAVDAWLLEKAEERAAQALVDSQIDKAEWYESTYKELFN